VYSPVQTIETTGQAAALMDPTRVQLMEELSHPGSASDLARRLGLPRQRINYHLRELEKAGLLREIEQRRKGNCVERIVQATARAYVLSPGMLGHLSPDPAQISERPSAAYLLGLVSRIIRDVTDGQRADAPPAEPARAEAHSSMIAFEAQVRFASDADRRAFSEDLATAVAQLIREYSAPAGAEGRAHRIVVAGCPVAAD
jgi:DNA-binding transcriptional ArsR family regulator